MNKIKITESELDLLMQDCHPEYSTSEEEYCGRGKGADVEYRFTITRKSDQKEFELLRTYNGSFEGWQDWIDGDFDLI